MPEVKDVVELPPDDEQQNGAENNTSTTDETINKSGDEGDRKEGKAPVDDVEDKNPLDGYEFRLKRPKHTA